MRWLRRSIRSSLEDGDATGGKRTLSGGMRLAEGNEMQIRKRVCRAGGFLLVALATAANADQLNREPATSPVDHAGVAAFNKAFADAIRSMNNQAVLSLWENDGVALLPDTAPVRGKAEMSVMLQDVSRSHPKARMESFTNECFDIEGSGPWVSEWCLEHQIVSEPGKPTFDGRGKMLLVLHQQASGEWRLVREMWNHAGPSEGASLTASDAH